MANRASLILTGTTCFLLGLLLAPRLPFGGAAEATIKGPKWLHGLALKCRSSGEADFTKDTKKFGIEVFRDENNGNLIYISENGSLSVVAGK